ncbi:unnamed protein product, partial [Symbiodinium microadriaticum]
MEAHKKRILERNKSKKPFHKRNQHVSAESGNEPVEVNDVEVDEDTSALHRVQLASAAISAKLASVLDGIEEETELFCDEYGQPFYIQNGEYIYLEEEGDSTLFHTEDESEAGMLVQYSLNPSSRRPIIVPIDRDSGQGFDDELEAEVQATITSALGVVDSALAARRRDKKNGVSAAATKAKATATRPLRPLAPDAEEYTSPYAQHLLTNSQQ